MMRAIPTPHLTLIFLALASLILIHGVAPAQATDWGLDQLMRALAQNPAGKASFTETKFIALLERPLESSGELLFVAPDRLEKRTLKPRPELMVLAGGQLSIERGRQKHRLSLQDSPEVAGMVESIRATLAGDRAALEKVYRIELQGSAERWILNLTPTEARIAALLSRIRIEGSGHELRRIDIFQADGDRSEMTIRKATP